MWATGKQKSEGVEHIFSSFIEGVAGSRKKNTISHIHSLNPVQTYPPPPASISTAKPVYREFETNIPRNETARPPIGLPILLEEICGPILGLYKSLTDP
jgi:hypothetical protein